MRTGYPRSVSAHEAIAAIHSGDTVALGTGCAEPLTLMEALVNEYARFRDVRLLTMVPASSCEYAKPEMAQHFRVLAFVASSGLHEALSAGRAEYIPCHVSEIPRLFTQGYLRPDVAMIQVAPPDEQGYCSLGISVDYLPAATKTARTVIAEVNTQMPRTYGDCRIALSDIDLIVESARSLLTIPSSPIGPVEECIAGLVADLVPDGATLQVGIGGIADAVLRGLDCHRKLRLHTGIITDGIIALARSENVLPPIVSTVAMGSQDLYEFLHENPLIAMHPCSYTHSLDILARIDGLVAVNSALQIDLTGQVNAESIRGKQVSGVGGQMDFIRGAARSPGGKAIIALPSTAGRGTVSRIVPHLDRGTTVTTPRTDVQLVVTEYGIADLRGKGLRERAHALIGIAHPQFREEMLKAMVQ